ncbi:DUF3006 domain-containing protein [Desulfallas thermosapovorans]|uniref:DUF3006 family protein n=1 Tax=Desulfallas thermosapovorans DSM 6562 TaxID=1121431 RepID=A0A5S4ZWZ4_9FIRM|nr:DUF3006 domain-containing protein [Desulfallas thermosapovorans]TYO97240.1 Protein of unknown function (DUF3006) [Desulfallas thermosapovorans DSM 6562]
MLVIDRFEGEYALIEYKRRIFHIPKVLVPKGARPGDVINIQISVDQEATGRRKQAMEKLAGRVFSD